MQRGEVWWADLEPPVGRRPVLLLSRSAAYAVRTSITVAPTTRTVWGIPVEVLLDREDGMPARCAVNLDNILTIPRGALETRITALSAEKMAEVRRAIIFALDL